MRRWSGLENDTLSRGMQILHSTHMSVGTHSERLTSGVELKPSRSR